MPPPPPRLNIKDKIGKNIPQNGQTTDFGETFYQLYVQLYLESPQ